MSMKYLGIALLVGSFVSTCVFIGSIVHAEYQWNVQYGSLWDLGVKASTIEQKSQYVDKFIQALQTSNLAGTHDAIFLDTPSNGFDENMFALKSLGDRMHSISEMSESSFEYQAAIQQITAQEQDEATDMLIVLKNSWFKVHHYFLWNGIFICLLIVGTMLATLMGIIIIIHSDERGY